MAEVDSAAKTNVFSKHKQTPNAPAGTQMPWSARFAIFIFFPLLVGAVGLYMGYLESKRKPDRELNFDTDFVMPFLLALTFAIVVGFQTKGYSTHKVEPLVKWPKVRRKRVARKTKEGGANEEEEEEEEAEGEEKDTTAKKDN